MQRRFDVAGTSVLYGAWREHGEAVAARITQVVVSDADFYLTWLDDVPVYDAVIYLNGELAQVIPPRDQSTQAAYDRYVRVTV